jgi:RNA polymerase sigma-70 factor (ECF subfamily)
MSVAHRTELRLVPKEDAAAAPSPQSGQRPVEERPEDHRLALALIEGEPWAAAATWNKLAPMVFRLLHRMLGPDADAEDLTQEVFLRVFSKVRGLRNPAALTSFVFSVALRTLKSELRRRRVRRVFALTDCDEVHDRAVDPLDAEARQSLGRFYAILDHLSAVDRAAFVFRHVEGMKLEEIGEALGISLATVKRRLDRAGQTVSRHVEREPALSAYLVRGKGGA